MSETAEIKVDVKTEENGVKRWNHLHLIQNGDVKNIFLVFNTEKDEVYIDYETVRINLGGNNNWEDYELTHEEEEAVIAYIVSNYEREQKDKAED